MRLQLENEKEKRKQVKKDYEFKIYDLKITNKSALFELSSLKDK